MPNLMAMSFEGELGPSFELNCLAPGRKPPDGWGIAYYPGGEPAACVLKEPAPQHGSIKSELVSAWKHVAARQFLLHIRHAMWGRPTDANTQPFTRSYAGRDWLFAHSGSLAKRPEARQSARFEAVGATDTEVVFCELLERIAERGWRGLGDADFQELSRWLDGFGELGDMACALMDGTDLCVYAGRDPKTAMYVTDIVPPFQQVILTDDDLAVDLTRRGAKSQRGMLVSSNPLTETSDLKLSWRRLAAGELLVIRGGALRASLTPTDNAAPVVQRFKAQLPSRAEPKRLKIRHRSAYSYNNPIERSSHLMRLEPVQDRLQRLVEFELSVSVEGQERRYEDVFGNQARRRIIETPFTDLVIEANSVVDLLDTDPLSFRPFHQSSAIPLVWMPWQRQVLSPYLLPPELPETELAELAEYAMGFADRNDYDLIETLLDINSTIFREYEYKQGATKLSTTAFEVYTNRYGVCQDFTNLFICLARLLGVPARYVCGYIYTGPKNENQVQSEASHAWTQVYLPEVGWKGFDPTNGIVTQTDHVRLAVGRNYVDATPTSGTIYMGGGIETLTADVRVEVVG